jgi:hypothetical protein
MKYAWPHVISIYNSLGVRAQSNLQNAVNLELYRCLYLFYFVSSPLGGSLGKEIYVSDFGVFRWLYVLYDEFLGEVF